MQTTLLKTAMDVGQDMVRAPQTGMNTDVTLAMIMLLRMEHYQEPIDPEIEGRLAFQLMNKRCQHHSIEVKPHVLALITVLVDRPGSAMLYVAALHYIKRKSPAGVIGLDKFIDFFPDGFPDEEELRRIWLQQKNPDAPLGNVLDDPSAWAV